MGLRRDPARRQARGAREGRDRAAGRPPGYRSHLHDGGLRGVLAARPRGDVLYRRLRRIDALDVSPRRVEGGARTADKDLVDIPLALTAALFGLFAVAEWRRLPVVARVYLGVAT